MISLAPTFTVLCILDVMSFRAATITSLHFLEAKWQLTSRAYFSKSVESPSRNSMSFRDVSNSSVSLITWNTNRLTTINKNRELLLKKYKTKKQQLQFKSYSAVLLQLAAIVRNAVEKTLIDDALWKFLPNQFAQDRWELLLSNGNV